VYRTLSVIEQSAECLVNRIDRILSSVTDTYSVYYEEIELTINDFISQSIIFLCESLKNKNDLYKLIDILYVAYEMVRTKPFSDLIK
jgi:hypothetical protein